MLSKINFSWIGNTSLIINEIYSNNSSSQNDISSLYSQSFNQPIGLVVECSPMGWETGFQSLVELYQRLKKLYLIPPYLTLSIIRYIARVKWSNPENGVVPSPTPRCSIYWKGSFR